MQIYDYKTLQERAEQQYRTAMHLLTVTYPLIKDPKLLLGIINNVFKVLENSLQAIIIHEAEQNKIAPNLGCFREMLHQLQTYFSKEQIQLMQEIQEIVDFQKKSPIEFRRKDCFVICGEDYDLKVVSLKKIKDYLEKTESVLAVINHHINRK